MQGRGLGGGPLTQTRTDHSTLLAGATGLERAKKLVTDYKTGKVPHMTPELWKAKKIVDSTLHPGTGGHKARGAAAAASASLPRRRCHG